MDRPWKVIAAFFGVFIAGAVFGGFFSVGIGARWLAKEAPATVAATPAPAPTPAATPAPETKQAPRPNPGPAAGAPVRPGLLTVPQSWQAPQLLRRYAERLELTPEQKQRIHPLIQRATEDYNRLRQNTFRETAIILDRLQQDISAVLTPEQRQKLTELEERQKEALQKAEQKIREQQQKKAAPQRQGQGPNRPAANGGDKPQPAPAAAEATAPAATAPTASTAGATTSTTASTEKKE